MGSPHRLPTDLAQANWGDLDPGTGKPLPHTKMAIIPIVTAAAETNTLPDPERVGLFLQLTCTLRSVGDRVVTVATFINQTGNNTITFNTTDDSILLMSIPYAGNTALCRWQVIVNDGTTLSTV